MKACLGVQAKSQGSSATAATAVYTIVDRASSFSACFLEGADARTYTFRLVLLRTLIIEVFPPKILRQQTTAMTIMSSSTLIRRASLRTRLYHPHCTKLSCFLSTSTEIEPIMDAERLQQRLQDLAPSMASSLASVGYWTNNPNDQPLVSQEEVVAMRKQSIALRNEGRFEQSLSETTTSTGEITEFPKEGVFACEPDGQDYYTAPDLLIYMSTIIGFLPPLLNNAFKSTTDDDNVESTLTLTSGELQLSNQAFNAKLAVTSPGGSVYPLHVDNTLGVKGTLQDDTRKLTCILYLNPDYVNEGGELRLVLGDTANHDGTNVFDLKPQGGRIVMFWSDEIPHEVLPCAPLEENEKYDRYALTVWIPDMDPRNIQPPGSKFQHLRETVF